MEIIEGLYHFLLWFDSSDWFKTDSRIYNELPFRLSPIGEGA